jgi:hypothetical protein
MIIPEAETIRFRIMKWSYNPVNFFPRHFAGVAAKVAITGHLRKKRFCQIKLLYNCRRATISTVPDLPIDIFL